ncbi:ATP-dependent DNA ligase [Streptomyces sp. NPDC054802]
MMVPPVEPMLARAVPRLPGPSALPGCTVFEPKYDGFRLLVFAGAERVFLQSRNGRDLTEAFPEITEAASALGEDVVLDGEAVIYREGRLDFGALQQRTNRRPSAVAELARREPAHFIAFDLLHHAGADMLEWPYRERRAALESLFQGHTLEAPWALTPTTNDVDQAEQWMRQWAQAGVEGIVAKGAAQPYRPGRRGWQKYRSRDTAEALIGAVTGTLTRPETVLLGRYTSDGELRLVARSTPAPPALRDQLSDQLHPGGPDHPWREMRISSHWGSRTPLDFTCVQPELIAEFHGDTAIDRGRWRHPVRLHRLRPDLTPDDLPPAEEPPPPSSGPSSPAGPRTKRGTMASKPKRTVYHITPSQDAEPGQAWEVQHKEGRRTLREPHRTQKQAIDAARHQAEDHKPAQVVVHGRDGRIRTEYTYGNDPRDIPG